MAFNANARKYCHHDQIDPSQSDGQFLAFDGGWTPDVRKARAFSFLTEATEAVRKLNLHDVELYYLCNPEARSPWDVVIPLR
jgi:hypothetical protein